MFRWIVVLAITMALVGCATDYRGYRYADGPYASTHVGGSTYYSTGHGGGDYYYGEARYGYGTSYQYPMWVDNPHYYSLFWPLHRSFIDPYRHPGFYYGVTYFPRNYFSISLYGGGYRPYASYSLAYSPYRYSWVDSYYDWYPFYRQNPRYYDNRYYPPRYGNARNEAERLARLSRQTPRYAAEGGLPASMSRHGQRATAGNPARDADYRGRTSPRLDPGVRGFNRDVASQRRGMDERSGYDSRLGQRNVDPRAADYGNARHPERGRQDPGVRGFNRDVVDSRRAGVGELREPAATDSRRQPTVAGFGRGEYSDRQTRGMAADPRLRGGSPAVPADRYVRREQPARSGYQDQRAISRLDRAPRSSDGHPVRTSPRREGYRLDGFGAAAASPARPAIERRGYDAPRYQAAPDYGRAAVRSAPPAAAVYREPARQSTPAYREQPARQAAPVSREPAYEAPTRSAVYESRSQSRSSSERPSYSRDDQRRR